MTLKIEEPQDEAPPPEIMELKRQFPFELITLLNDSADGGAIIVRGRVPRAFREKNSGKERFKEYILMIFFFWIVPAVWLSERISNSWNLGMAVLWGGACMVGITVAKPWIGGSDFITLLIILVLSIPALIFFTGAIRGR